MNRALVIALTAALTTLSGSALAEPIRLLIAAPAGGGTDGLFRSLATQVAEKLGDGIVPINMPAAGGGPVIEQVMRSPANGQTIGAVANSTLTSSPHLIRVPFGQDDYLPLLQVSAAAYTMCVAPTFPAKDTKEFLAAIKAQPGKYTVGTDPGIGQLAAGRILKALNLDARLIPFKGASEIVASFLGGHVDVYQGSIPVILPHVAAGRAKCMLVTGTERSAKLPSAASLSELGIPAEATTLTRLIVLHKDTPSPVAARVLDAFESAGRSEETRKLLEAAGDTFVITKGPQLRQALRAEFDAFGATARRLGIAQ